MGYDLEKFTPCTSLAMSLLNYSFTKKNMLLQNTFHSSRNLNDMLIRDPVHIFEDLPHRSDCTAEGKPTGWYSIRESGTEDMQS